MILTTLDTVPGRVIAAHYGVVSGSTVRSKHIGRDLIAGIKSLFGGELRGYTELLEEAREEAIRRMVASARKSDANAILNIRLATSSVANGAAELFAYGTAVKLE